MLSAMTELVVGSREWIVHEIGYRHLSTRHVMQYFAWDHLPGDLAGISAMVGVCAIALVQTLPDGPELTIALRKLLEGKDAAVRAGLDARESTSIE